MWLKSKIQKQKQKTMKKEDQEEENGEKGRRREKRKKQKRSKNIFSKLIYQLTKNKYGLKIRKKNKYLVMIDNYLL